MDTTAPSRKGDRPTGFWISVLSFPIGAFFAATELVMLWCLFRELYCRANYAVRTEHQLTNILCTYFDWEFRPDAMLVFVATLFMYAIIHFWWLRRLSRRSHFLTLLSLALAWGLAFSTRWLVPGPWEAWY